MRGFRSALCRAAARTRAELQGARGRRLSHSAAAPARPSFGIAFDIDGVILRGRSPIGGSPQAIRRLYADDGNSGASRALLHLVELARRALDRECLVELVRAKCSRSCLPHSCLCIISSYRSYALAFFLVWCGVRANYGNSTQIIACYVMRYVCL